MSAEFWGLLLAGAAMGGFINGLAGFGTSLFALGWWLQVMPPSQAVALVLLMAVASGLPGVAMVRRSIRWRRLGVFLIPALAGVPFGLYLLHLIDPGALKLVIAGFLLLYGGFFLARRDLPSLTRETPVIDAGIGFSGGVLGAMAGLSGALPTMWCAMREWPKAETRAVLQPFNVAVLAISAVGLAFQGVYDRDTLLLAAAALPVTMLGARLGMWAFQQLEDQTFRKLLIALMFVSGAALMLRELL